MDMAKYLTLTKITTLKDTFRADCLRIMVFFLHKVFSTKASLNSERPPVKENIFKDLKPSRESSKKIIPKKIAYKMPKTTHSSETMNKVPGAKANLPGITSSPFTRVSSAKG